MCGATFRAVALVVFMAFEPTSMPICSAKLRSIVSCQLLKINLDENQMSGHLQDNDPKHMSKLANEWRLKHGIYRIQ